MPTLAALTTVVSALPLFTFSLHSPRSPVFRLADHRTKGSGASAGVVTDKERSLSPVAEFLQRMSSLPSPSKSERILLMLPVAPAKFVGELIAVAPARLIESFPSVGNE